MASLQNFNQQSAFDLIKRYAAEKNSRNGRKKEGGKALMIRAFANYNETKLRAYFNKMRQWRDKCVTREVKMRTAFSHLSSSSLRSYFLNWKDKAHQSTVHLQNEEEDGPTNLQAWQLRQDNFNLIRLMKEDGLTN